MNSLVSRYNEISGVSLRPITARDFMDVPCKAKYISSTSNGKFPEDTAGNTNIMEYS
jgi:hypothetical protein